MRSAFPELRFSSVTVEERGGDHRVLLLDATYAFRFPRRATHHLGVEIALLAALRGRCETAVPDYLFVDPAGRFAGYRLIAGDELTPRLFARLDARVRHDVLDQAGRFLAVLHGLAPGDVPAIERWPLAPTAAEHAAHARTHHLPSIAAAFPRLAGPLCAFYEDYAADLGGPRVVLHGDLVDDHLLLAPDRQRLAGIIDFGDVALGDPARDLLGFWAYGPEAVARVAAAYGAGADHDLRERSRRAYVAYRIDRFCDLLATEGEAVAARSLAALTRLLASWGVQAPACASSALALGPVQSRSPCTRHSSLPSAP